MSRDPEATMTEDEEGTERETMGDEYEGGSNLLIQDELEGVQGELNEYEL